jgi:hypothetical protein
MDGGLFEVRYNPTRPEKYKQNVYDKFMLGKTLNDIMRLRSSNTTNI